jgi:YihY family inner membrane protein
MTEEPYRWLDAIGNRREYIREQLKGGTPVFALSRPEGILLLGVGLLVVTVVASALQHMATEFVLFEGRELSLGRLSAVLLYLIGVTGEVLLLATIYLVMPVGRLSWRHALVGGVAATVLWEISRHVLVWYFATLSQVRTVYGSLTTAIVVLLSLEIAAIVLLFGAQVIAEYERIGKEPIEKKPEGMRTPKV